VIKREVQADADVKNLRQRAADFSAPLPFWDGNSPDPGLLTTINEEEANKAHSLKAIGGPPITMLWFIVSSGPQD
jgi:hypothetical protein